MVDFCIQLMAKIIDTNSADAKQYVTDVITKFNLKFTSEEEIAEVCLIILSILKDSIKDRLDVQIIIDCEMVKLTKAFLNLDKSNPSN